MPAPDVESLPEQPVAPPPSRQSARGPRPRPPQHAAAVIGPPAVRDEYLARLVALVRPHLRLLQPGLLNGRHGTTSLAIRVLGDGTIARIAVSQSSGYPDIDARVIQIVASVGRFPPLPPGSISRAGTSTSTCVFRSRRRKWSGGRSRDYGSRDGAGGRARCIASRISLGWLSIASHSRRIWRRRL